MDNEAETRGYVTCTHCGWVGCAVSPEQMNEEIKKFNDWYFKQNLETKRLYGHYGASESEYACQSCGHYGPYRPFKTEDCPAGCTISSVVIYPKRYSDPHCDQGC